MRIQFNSCSAILGLLASEFMTDQGSDRGLETLMKDADNSSPFQVADEKHLQQVRSRGTCYSAQVGTVMAEIE